MVSAGVESDWSRGREVEISGVAHRVGWGQGEGAFHRDGRECVSVGLLRNLLKSYSRLYFFFLISIAVPTL